MPHFGHVTVLLPKSRSASFIKLAASSSIGENAEPISSAGLSRNLSYPIARAQFSQYMTPLILMILFVSSAPHLLHLYICNPPLTNHQSEQRILKDIRSHYRSYVRINSRERPVGNSCHNCRTFLGTHGTERHRILNQRLRLLLRQVRSDLLNYQLQIVLGANRSCTGYGDLTASAPSALDNISVAARKSCA